MVAGEAGARLSEETARKGGQRREISADVRMCICDKRTKIYRFTRGYAGGLDGRRSQRRIVNIKRVRSNAKR